MSDHEKFVALEQRLNDNHKDDRDIIKDVQAHAEIVGARFGTFQSNINNKVRRFEKRIKSLEDQNNYAQSHITKLEQGFDKMAEEFKKMVAGFNDIRQGIVVLNEGANKLRSELESQNESVQATLAKYYDDIAELMDGWARFLKPVEVLR